MMSLNESVALSFILIAILLTATLFLFFYKNRKLKNHIIKYFDGHTSKKVLMQIRDNAKKIHLTGQERIITVMFVDVRGFTSLAEKYSNKRVLKILNYYLRIISECIIKNCGLIDKYLGDGVMAFWGSPLFDRYQASRAIKTALQIQTLFKKEDACVGIGINTGSAIVGNIGRKEMICYTAIGNTVNLSARIESLNKHYGTEILVSKNTLDKFHSEPKKYKFDVLFREVDKVKVYGKVKSTVLHEPILISEDFNGRQKEGYEWFELGLNMYRKGDWEKAVNMFRTADKRLGRDNVSKTFIQRCQEFMISPPQGRWDGTISLGK